MATGTFLVYIDSATTSYKPTTVIVEWESWAAVAELDNGVATVEHFYKNYSAAVKKDSISVICIISGILLF